MKPKTAINPKKVIKSFPHAVRGIMLVFNERNMQVHLLAVAMVIVFGFWLSISNLEWLIIFLCFALVTSLETLNSAIENVCNKLRDDLSLSYDATKNARDLSAGAVLIASFFSALIGLVIFVPKILYLLIY